MIKKYIAMYIIGLANLVYASDVSYDELNITPNTWQEVNLTYTQQINGKDYIEFANIVRPTTWLNKYHLDKVGQVVAVHESDVGINATVTVVAIKPIPLSFTTIENHKKYKPVIGTYLKHSNDVWSYTFSNGETIKATSNHRFYNIEQQKYIPIGEFEINGDHLLTVNNSKVQLFSKVKHNKGVEAVYNFEVYQSHNYYVSQNNSPNSILVHNPNGADCNFKGSFAKELSQNPDFIADYAQGGGCFFTAGGCIAKYAYNKPVSDYITAHVQQRSYAVRFSRFITGDVYDELPNLKVFGKIGAKNITREHFTEEIFSNDSLKSIVSSLTNTENGKPRAAFIEISKHYIGIVGRNNQVIISDIAFIGKKYWMKPSEVDYNHIVDVYHDTVYDDKIYSITYMQ